MQYPGAIHSSVNPPQIAAPEKPALPNFFVVGTPKAGTTALYHYLGQHPAIYLSPIKEPAFFAEDLFELKRQLGKGQTDPAGLSAYLDGPMTEQRSGVIGEWEQYLKLFKNVRQETAVGEASGNYLASSKAPRAIRERIPYARIVIMLRDPADRLFSQYSEALAKGQARPEFLSWVEEQQAAEASRKPRLGAVWNGFYAQHLRRYREHFPPRQIRTHFYDDYLQSPRAVLRDLFGFLNVDPEFSPDLSRRHNVTLQPRSFPLRNTTAPLRKALARLLPPALVNSLRRATHRRTRPLTNDERAAVLKIYAADIRELQLMLKRDLSAWLNPATR